MYDVITYIHTVLCIYSGVEGQLLLSTVDYPVGEHDLTITAIDSCGGVETLVYNFVTPESMLKVMQCINYNFIVKILSMHSITILLLLL